MSTIIRAVLDRGSAPDGRTLRRRHYIRVLKAAAGSWGRRCDSSDFQKGRGSTGLPVQENGREGPPPRPRVRVSPLKLNIVL